jgi:hypothetical protein
MVALSAPRHVPPVSRVPEPRPRWAAHPTIGMTDPVGRVVVEDRRPLGFVSLVPLAVMNATQPPHVKPPLGVVTVVVGLSEFSASLTRLAGDAPAPQGDPNRVMGERLEVVRFVIHSAPLTRFGSRDNQFRTGPFRRSCLSRVREVQTGELTREREYRAVVGLGRFHFVRKVPDEVRLARAVEHHLPLLVPSVPRHAFEP